MTLKNIVINSFTYGYQNKSYHLTSIQLPHYSILWKLNVQVQLMTFSLIQYLPVIRYTNCEWPHPIVTPLLPGRLRFSLHIFFLSMLIPFDISVQHFVTMLTKCMALLKQHIIDTFTDKAVYRTQCTQCVLCVHNGRHCEHCCKLNCIHTWVRTYHTIHGRYFTISGKYLLFTTVSASLK